MIALVLSSSVNAALLSRDLDGNRSTVEGYYDEATNLTWLASANYSMSSGYDSDGLMTWNDSMNWVSQDLNSVQYGGGFNWRLPTTPNSDHDCSDWTTVASCFQGELAQLFYNTLGNNVFGQVVVDPFTDVQQAPYWSSSVYEVLPGKPVPGGSLPGTALIITFDMGNGFIRTVMETDEHYAWAVHEGDIGVSAVPVPAAVWLFASGLICLIGFAKRNKV